jgi:hypothetical protein
MNLKQLFASITLLLMIFSSVIAQSPDSQDSTKKEEQRKAQEEREKKALVLLDEIIKEAQLLKLPENRIRVQAGAADMLWPRDEKRARALFKEIIISFSEMTRKIDTNPQQISGMAITGMEPYIRRSNPAINIYVCIQVRQEILRMLMRHDGKWAREFLRESRQAVDPTEANIGMAHIETMMDMQFANQLAGSEPKQAVEIAQENLDRVFSTGQQDSLIGIMQQTQNKDRESAAKLAGEFMKKLRSENLASNLGLANTAMNFLRTVTQPDKEDSSEKQSASKNNSLLLDEQSLKDLVGMVMTAALAKNNGSSDDEYSGDELNLMVMQSILPQIEKYAPSRAPAVRAKVNEYIKSLPPETQAWSEIAGKGDSASVDDILNAAAKMPAETRSEMYGVAAQNAIRKGDIERARQIINEKIANADQRKALLADADRQMLAGAATQGKLEDARQMLAQVESPEERAIILSQLATTVAAKGDRKNGIHLIGEARGLVGNQLENAVQFAAQIAIARAAISIDAAQSFDVLEWMTDRFNALVEASAVLDGFENRQQFREGEMILQGPSQINNMLQYWSKILQSLARTDFDRARTATERFQRSEVRLMIRLSIVGGVLSDKVDEIDVRPFIQFMSEH